MNTVPTCLTCCRFTENVTTHSWYPTTDTTPTNFTRRYPTFLQIPLHTHILIENKQFLLLVDVPIQDRSRQITIHHILTLDIPQGNYSACFDVDTKYLGITKDATMAVELSTIQFQTCQEANGQFCSIITPFQPLANPPSCIAMSTVDMHLKMLIVDMQSINYHVYLPKYAPDAFGSLPHRLQLQQTPWH